MSKQLFFLPVGVTQQIFRKSSVKYKASDIWNLFNKMANGGTLSRAESDMLWDFYLSMAILVIAQKYPTTPVIYQPGKGFISGQNQIDELTDIAMDMEKFYGADPQKRVIDYFPTPPSNISEERRFHAHFKTKGANLWKDKARRRWKDPLERRIAEMNQWRSFVDPKGKNGLDGSDSSYDDEISATDTDEQYAFEQDFGKATMDEWFDSQELLTYFNESVETKRAELRTNKLKVRVVRSLNEQDLAQIAQTLLAGKVSEPSGRHDDSVDFYFTGSPRHIFRLTPAEGETNSKVNKGVLIARKPITGNQAREVKASLHKRDSNHLIALSLFDIETGADVFDTEAQDVLQRIDLEIIDLLLLAELIQKGFSKLSPDLQQMLTRQIEVMVKDL